MRPVAVAGRTSTPHACAARSTSSRALADSTRTTTFLRVVVEGPIKAGLAEDVRELLGRAVVEVRLAAPVDAPGGRTESRSSGADAARAVRRVPRERGRLRRAAHRALRRAARRGERELMRPISTHRRGVHGVSRRGRRSTSPAPSSSRSSARPARASRASSTRSASRSTASSRATTTIGSSRPSITQGANEARVSLTFELGGSRVRRDADRAAHRRRGATTKEARLECDGEVLAGDAKGMNDAVAELIGLPFRHFTRCVILPQGEFARVPPRQAFRSAGPPRQAARPRHLRADASARRAARRREGRTRSRSTSR